MNTIETIRLCVIAVFRMIAAAVVLYGLFLLLQIWLIVPGAPLVGIPVRIAGITVLFGLILWLVSRPIAALVVGGLGSRRGE